MIVNNHVRFLTKRHFIRLTILFSVIQLSKQHFNKNCMINFITKNCSIWYTELGPKTEGNERRLQRRPLVSYLLNLLNGVKSLACTKSGVSRNK